MLNNIKYRRMIALILLLLPLSIIIIMSNIKQTDVSIINESAKKMTTLANNNIDVEEDNVMSILKALYNTNKIESGKVDSQIKLLTLDEKVEKHNELLTISFLSNFSKNENNSFNFSGIFSLDINNLDIDLDFPANINNLKEDSFEIFLEVPVSYKKAFDMKQKEKYLYINKDTIKEIKELFSGFEEKTLKVESERSSTISSEKDIKNKITSKKINKDSVVYDFNLNNEDLLYIYNKINNKENDSEVFRKPIAFSCGLETQANGQLLSNCQTNELQSLVGDFILKYFSKNLLKDENNIRNIKSFKGQLGATNEVATDVYIEITNFSGSVVAMRITMENINNKEIVVSELNSKEIKKFEKFLKPLLEANKIDETKVKNKNKINIGNIYFTGEDETIKVEKFNSKNFDKNINVFINFSKCTKNTNLIVKWFYENQEIPIIENKLSNGSYTDGILKTSISFKDKESIPKGNYRIQITIEGQDKIHGEAKFNVK